MTGQQDRKGSYCSKYGGAFDCIGWWIGIIMVEEADYLGGIVG